MSDISGNSHIENPYAPEADPHCVCSHYKRSAEEDKLLGIFENVENSETPDADLNSEVHQFNTNCYSCGASCFTNMKITRMNMLRIKL